MHDVCTTHIRQNSVHGYPKLLVVKHSFVDLQLGLGLGTGNGYFIPFFILKVTKTPLSWPPGPTPVR